MMTPSKPNIGPANNEIALVTLQKRKFQVFLLQDHELDTLNRGYISVHFALFGVFLGCCLGLLPSAYVLPLNDPMKPWFCIGAFFLGCASIYCFCASIAERRNVQDLVDKIKTTGTETEIVFDVRSRKS